eukprot:TRINITY_DN3235_c1_g1_i2.p1 TRINITY_DN3235_c1_g1~~TRINITY_DN3235_c1_g1_i2.p1  ORF type:complete len:188 (-),score=-15.80 TRINITY_DN3235_c1_g1_i2:140-703(-)
MREPYKIPQDLSHARLGLFRYIIVSLFFQKCKVYYIRSTLLAATEIISHLKLIFCQQIKECTSKAYVKICWRAFSIKFIDFLIIHQLQYYQANSINIPFNTYTKNEYHSIYHSYPISMRIQVHDAFNASIKNIVWFVIQLKYDKIRQSINDVSNFFNHKKQREGFFITMLKLNDNNKKQFIRNTAKI